jgi:hypothetical protein
MKPIARVFFLAASLVLILSIPTAAQNKPAPQKQTVMSGTKMDMARMPQSSHHNLMMAYMQSMSAFATALRDQAIPGMDIEVARATVAELRHNLDAIEGLHEKQMQSMSAEMQSRMRQQMDKDRAMLKDQVSALETDVQVDKPEIAELKTHADALLNHLTAMMKSHGGKPGMKKMTSMKKM